MVKISLYPFAAATIASAIPAGRAGERVGWWLRPAAVNHGGGRANAPVLPLVGSTSTVFPGVISPRFSASTIIELPMRSFTLLQGSIDS